MDNAHWAPLEALARMRPDLNALRDFMFMGHASARTGTLICLYKHADTRRYLNLDHAGHAYAYDGRGDNGQAAYVPMPDLASAIAHAYS